MSRLGIPQKRISSRLGELREIIQYHLSDMLMLANPINSDIEKGFTVSQTAEKHGWPEILVGFFKPDGKNDADKYKELQTKGDVL